ncbi:MAG: hypothetical protein RLY97_1378 [Pseudomonadota bacterium]
MRVEQGFGQSLAGAAEALIGCRFRLYGRDPASGLDCVGVLAAALKSVGGVADFPCDYALRMRDVVGFVAQAEGLGFAAVVGEIARDDAVMVQVGPHQFHLAIAAGAGEFIHAHAGLRRVVKAALLPEWEMVGHWRMG